MAGWCSTSGWATVGLKACLNTDGTEVAEKRGIQSTQFKTKHEVL